MAAHTLMVEVDLVTAGDIEPRLLGRTLLSLATAGLMGMVVAIPHAQLDGNEIRDPVDRPEMSITAIRPPPDERVAKALLELDRIRDSLAGVVGRASTEEAVVA